MSNVDAVIGRLRHETGPTSLSVDAPTVTSQWMGILWYWRNVSNWTTVNGTFQYRPTTTQWERVLLSIEPFSGQQVSLRHVQFEIVDEGPVANEGRHTLGGASGSPPPEEDPPPQVYDQQFWFDWHGSYNQFGRTSAENYIASDKMRQGKDAYTNNPYACALRMPNAARSLMLGASNVEVWVRLTHSGPYSTGVPRFGRHTSSAGTPPSSMPTIFSPHLPTKSLAKGGTYWYKMPASWAAGFIAGTYYGITLGHTSTAFDFMDFYNTSYWDTDKRPRLRVRATK